MIAKWRYVLWPLLWINALRINLRNRLFDLQVWKSVEFEKPTIFVSSLNGRSTLGVSMYISKLLHTALHIKDNPGSSLNAKDKYLYFQSRGESVFQTNHTILGLSEWYQHYPETSGMVMDNEFAQNEIRPQFKILVSEMAFPFYKDELCPVGHLLATKAEIGTADVVLVCGATEDGDLNRVETEIKSYMAKDVPVFFIKNSTESLDSFKSADKIEFIQDHNNFARLMVNFFSKANPESE